MQLGGHWKRHDKLKRLYSSFDRNALLSSKSAGICYQLWKWDVHSIYERLEVGAKKYLPQVNGWIFFYMTAHIMTAWAGNAHPSR